MTISTSSFLGCATVTVTPDKPSSGYSKHTSASRSLASLNNPVSRLADFANNVKMAYDNFDKPSRLLSWLIANEGAMNNTDPTLIVDNLPSFSDQDIAGHVAALEAEIELPPLDYRVVSQLPNDYPLANNFGSFHAKLRETVQYNEALDFAIQEHIHLEYLLNLHKEHLKLVDETFWDIGTDYATGVFYQLYVKYEHFDLLMKSKPAVSDALKKVRKNKKRLEKKRDANRQAVRAMLIKANVPTDNAISNLNLLISAWEEEQDLIFSEGNELSKVQTVQEAELNETRKNLDLWKNKLIGLNREIPAKESRLASKRRQLGSARNRLRRVNRDISNRQDPYNCDGGAGHDDPFQRDSRGYYVCYEKKSKDARRLWTSQNRQQREEREVISKLAGQVSSLRNDLARKREERDKLPPSIEEAELRIQILVPLIEERDVQIQTLLESYWANPNGAEEYNEKMIIAQQALIELQDISYEIDY